MEVRAVLQAPSQRLGLRDRKVPGVYRTPLEVFTRHKPVRPLMRAIETRHYCTASAEDELARTKRSGDQSIARLFI